MALFSINISLGVPAASGLTDKLLGYGMCSDKNFIKLRMLIYVDTEYCNS